MVRRGAAVLWQIAGTWLYALQPATGAVRRRQAPRLAAQTLRALGVKLTLRGTPPPRGQAHLVVSNHISWLDIYVLNAVMETRFVSKSEARHWPLVGTIANRFDTIFIERGSVRAAARATAAVAGSLRDGDCVVVFPEGTTTDGSYLKRFHPALFQAAIDTGAPIQPVAIRYSDGHGRPSLAAPYINDISFAASLLRVVREPTLNVEIRFGRPISSSGKARHELAELTRQAIADELGLA